MSVVTSTVSTSTTLSSIPEHLDDTFADNVLVSVPDEDDNNLGQGAKVGMDINSIKLSGNGPNTETFTFPPIKSPKSSLSPSSEEQVADVYASFTPGQKVRPKKASVVAYKILTTNFNLQPSRFLNSNNSTPPIFFQIVAAGVGSGIALCAVTATVIAVIIQRVRRQRRSRGRLQPQQQQGPSSGWTRFFPSTDSLMRPGGDRVGLSEVRKKQDPVVL